LLVTTDRLSAFDVVLPDAIPHRGKVLTSLSEFWFAQTAHFVQNAMITTNINTICTMVDMPVGVEQMLVGRSMLMHKCQQQLVECVVRGYLVGSGWSEYQRTQTVCGIKLSPGLIEASKLSNALFTPSTKAGSGFHDENITFERACEIVGRDAAHKLMEYSLALYTFAARHAVARGIIIADTKFEFGLWNGQLVLNDEALTPDSSQFWPADQYEPGRSQSSFDKQFVRDYLDALCKAGKWDKTPNNVPVLPPEIVAQTSEKYLEALRRLTA